VFVSGKIALDSLHTDGLSADDELRCGAVRVAMMVIALGVSDIRCCHQRGARDENGRCAR
jgi:hypothetical protein